MFHFRQQEPGGFWKNFNLQDHKPQKVGVCFINCDNTGQNLCKKIYNFKWMIWKIKQYCGINHQIST